MGGWRGGRGKGGRGGGGGGGHTNVSCLLMSVVCVRKNNRSHKFSPEEVLGRGTGTNAWGSGALSTDENGLRERPRKIPHPQDSSGTKIKHEKIVGTKMVGKNLRILKTRLVCMCACVSVRVCLSWRVRMHVRACKACASATS